MFPEGMSSFFLDKSYIHSPLFYVPTASPLGVASPLFGESIQATISVPRTSSKSPTQQPNSKRSGDSSSDRRKQTLLTILDALQELSDTNGLNTSTKGEREAWLALLYLMVA